MTNETEQMVLVHDPDRCVGCRFCMVACSHKHFGVVDLSKSNIRIYFDLKTLRFEAIYCHHCDDPICMAVCPVNAIVKDENTGIVRIQPAKCIGCRLCNTMCPLSVPWFDVNARISEKCNLCDGDPECVKFCPAYALQLVPREQAKKQLAIAYKVVTEG